MSEETKFDRCDNYDAMLKEINERGARIKKLGEEVKLAYNEGVSDARKTLAPLWDSSRARRIAEGLE